MVRMTCKLCGWSTQDETNIVYAVKSLEEHLKKCKKREKRGSAENVNLQTPCSKATR